MELTARVSTSPRSRPRRRWGSNPERDRALRALLAHPSITRTTVRAMRACWVVQHGDSGRLLVRVPQPPGGKLEVLLSDQGTQALLEYLEAARLWGQDAPLFPGTAADGGLTRAGLRSVLNRLDGIK